MTGMARSLWLLACLGLALCDSQHEAPMIPRTAPAQRLGNILKPTPPPGVPELITSLPHAGLTTFLTAVAENKEHVAYVKAVDLVTPSNCFYRYLDEGSCCGNKPRSAAGMANTIRRNLESYEDDLMDAQGSLIIDDLWSLSQEELKALSWEVNHRGADSEEKAPVDKFRVIFASSCFKHSQYLLTHARATFIFQLPPFTENEVRSFWYKLSFLPEQSFTSRLKADMDSTFTELIGGDVQLARKFLHSVLRIEQQIVAFKEQSLLELSLLVESEFSQQAQGDLLDLAALLFVKDQEHKGQNEALGRSKFISLSESVCVCKLEKLLVYDFSKHTVGFRNRLAELWLSLKLQALKSGERTVVKEKATESVGEQVAAKGGEGKGTETAPSAAATKQPGTVEQPATAQKVTQKDSTGQQAQAASVPPTPQPKGSFPKGAAGQGGKKEL